MTRPAILIVEDEDLQYEIYQDALEGYDLVRARSGQEALQVLTSTPVKLIILDHVLAEGDLGLDYLPDLRELLSHIPIIVVSGALEVHEQLRALQGAMGADFCLTKPVDLDELNMTVERALRECGEVEVVRKYEALEKTLRANMESLLNRATDRLTRQKVLWKKVRDSGEKPNISALAREFSVARRTIVRDLEELIRRGQLAPDIFPKEERTPANTQESHSSSDAGN